MNKTVAYLSFCVTAVRRISISFWRILIFSRISAAFCVLVCIRLTHLFLSFFITSYSFANSFNLKNDVIKTSITVWYIPDILNTGKAKPFVENTQLIVMLISIYFVCISVYFFWWSCICSCLVLRSWTALWYLISARMKSLAFCSLSSFWIFNSAQFEESCEKAIIPNICKWFLYIVMRW